MDVQDPARTMNPPTSFGADGFTPSSIASGSVQSLSLRPTPSIENFSPYSPNEAITNASSAQRSPSFSSIAGSRQSSPAMESRPARKQTAPGALDLEIPVSYTPTTHRISKAKKGKKVHVCEFGCGKVFTRAEHRKRHEANHKTEPSYKCHVEGCHKPFQRRDLLDRHLERQHSIVIGKRSHRASSVPSNAGDSVTGSPGPAIAASQSLKSPVLLDYSHSDSQSLMPGGYLAPSRARALSQPLSSHQQPFNMPTSETTRSYTPDFVSEDPVSIPHALYGTGNFYASDISNNPFHKPVDVYPNNYSPLPIDGSYGSYQQAMGGSFGIDLSGGQFPSHVGFDSTAYIDMEPASRSSTTQPSPYSSKLPPDELVGVIDEETRRHYEVCYWETVDPIFPVTHYGTYIGGRNHIGLRDVVCALGAQSSPRPSAKQHSVVLFDSAVMHCQNLSELHAVKTPLEFLQLTFLLEYLGLYRWRMPGVYGSQRFTMLFNSLLSEHQNLQNGPDGYIITADASSAYAGEHHTRWIDLESRRRLLAACFILDTHRSKLFEQRSMTAFSAAPVISEFAIPSGNDLWTADTARWHALIATPQVETPVPTYFHLSLSHGLSLAENGTIALHIPPDVLALTLQLATHTPVRPLLVTAAGSWLFTRKVSEANWHSAKAELRAWSVGQDATIAAWLAGKVLREYFFAHSKPQQSAVADRPAHLQSRPGMVRLEVCWCLYLASLVLWAYTAPASRSPSVALSPPLSAPYSQTEMQVPQQVPYAGDPSSSSASHQHHRRHQQHQQRANTLPEHSLTRADAIGFGNQGQQQQQQPQPLMILPSQPAGSTTLLQSPPPTSHPKNQPRLSPSFSSSSPAPPPPLPLAPPLPQQQQQHGAGPSRRKFKAVAHQQPGPSPLVLFLSQLDSPSWQEVVQVRGAGGVQPVLAAVKGAMLDGETRGGGGQGVVWKMGCLVGEAVGVLDRLEGKSGAAARLF